MAKRKTQVAQKRSRLAIKFPVPLEVVGREGGELVPAGIDSLTADERGLAHEWLAVLQNAFRRADVILTPGEGFRLVGLEMGEWSERGRAEVLGVLVSSLGQMLKTKRETGEIHSASYDAIKLLSVKFCPKANPAPSAHPRGLDVEAELTKVAISPQYRLVGQDAGKIQARATEELSPASGNLPAVPFGDLSRLEFPSISDFKLHDFAKAVEDILGGMHKHIVERFQESLGHLEGHTTGTYEGNAQLADAVRQMAASYGIALIYEGKPVKVVCLNPETTSFQLRSAIGKDTYVASSKLWPPLGAVPLSEIPKPARKNARKLRGDP